MRTSRRDRDAPAAPSRDNVLYYADQGAFMGLRALGRGPVIQCSWVYDHPVSGDAVEELNQRLARGFLGRVVQRSPLPFGRHHWVASPVPPPVTTSPDSIAAAQLPQWRSSLIDLAIDPEHGPGWRLVVQPLHEGGTAVALLISHVIVDGLGACAAVADAVSNVRFEHVYPSASRRMSWRNLTGDAWRTLRAIPEVCKAVAFIATRSGAVRADVSASAAKSRHATPEQPSPRVDVPSLQAVLDEQAVVRCAAERGVTVNTLLAAVAARLGFRLGRVDRDGRVKLVLPVSDRARGDLRGNALRPVHVMADPAECASNPAALQRQLRSALSSLLRRGDQLSPLFPLIPYVPLRLARQLEGLALGADLPVGCVILGEMDPALNRPCGTDASQCHVYLLERHSAAMLDRMEGRLYVLCYRLSGQVLINVSAWAPDRITSRDDLLSVTQEALGDFSLACTAQ